MLYRLSIPVQHQGIVNVYVYHRGAEVSMRHSTRAYRISTSGCRGHLAMLSSGPFFPAFVLINETRLNPIALIVPSEQKSHEFDYGFFYFGSIVRVKNSVWPTLHVTILILHLEFPLRPVLYLVYALLNQGQPLPAGMAGVMLFVVALENLTLPFYLCCVY